MKSKKAILLPTSLRLIIGGLCIVILIALAWKLYTLFLVKSDYEQAKASLEEISGKLNAMGVGDKTSHLLIVPENWIFVSFPGEKKLCICSHVFSYNPAFSKANIEKDCKEDGICKDMRKAVNLYSSCDLNEMGSETAANCLVITKNSLILSENAEIFEIKPEARAVMLDFLSESVSLEYKDAEGSLQSEEMNLKELLTLYIKHDQKTSLRNEQGLVKAIYELFKDKYSCRYFAFAMLEGDEKGIRWIGVTQDAELNSYLNKPFPGHLVDESLLKTAYYPFKYASFSYEASEGKSQAYTVGYTHLKECAEIK